MIKKTIEQRGTKRSTRKEEASIGGNSLTSTFLRGQSIRRRARFTSWDKSNTEMKREGVEE